MPETPRIFRSDDAAWAASAFRREIQRPGRTRWTSVSPERIAYWMCLDHPARGAGFAMTDADGAPGFAGFQLRNERSDTAELVGPHPHREEFAPLVGAAQAEARRRGLRLVTWIGEEDAARERFFERQGFQKASPLRWLRGVTSPLTRDFGAYASDIEIVPASVCLDSYLRLYNEALSEHVGLHVITEADMRFRLEDPVARVSSFFVSFERGAAVGCIEVWPDCEPDEPPGARAGWVGNLIVAPDARENVEIHLALYVRSLVEARRLGLGQLRGLLDPRRGRLIGLYNLFGWRVESEFSGWEWGAEAPEGAP